MYIVEYLKVCEEYSNACSCLNLHIIEVWVNSHLPIAILYTLNHLGHYFTHWHRNLVYIELFGDDEHMFENLKVCG